MEAEQRAITADATHLPRVADRMVRSVTENRAGDIVVAPQPQNAIVCIGADASSLLSVVRPLASAGGRVTVVDVVSEWITSLKRSSLTFRVKLVGLDEEVTETTSHSVDACANFYADLSSDRIIYCDLLASALAAEELLLFTPHLLTLLRRRKALNPRQPLRVLQIDRVSLPAGPAEDLSVTLPQAAAEKWPTEAMHWLAEQVTFQRALAVELLPQNIRSYDRGKIVAVQSAQLLTQVGQPPVPGSEPCEDLNAARDMAQLAQSLSFLVGIAKNTIKLKLPHVQEALQEAFDASPWANKNVADTLAQMLCSSQWSLQQHHTLNVPTVAACIQPTLQAYQVAQHNDWKRLSLRRLLQTSLVPLNRNGQIEQMLRHMTEDDGNVAELVSLLH